MALSGKIKTLPLFFFLLGCPPSGTFYVKKGYRPPPLSAVLPMDNHTNDVDGPDHVRYWFHRRFPEKKGYRLQPLEETDAVLNQLGIKDGGQLPAFSPQELGKKLNVQALIYGDLLEFEYKTTGFLNVRRVQASFKMVDAATGERLWEVQGNGANSSGSLSGAGALKAGAQALGGQIVNKATNSPLRTEIWDMIWDAVQYLPRGR